MNVRIAVETLSSSTANSLEFLMKENFEEFANAKHTIFFTRLFNNIFDIFNAKLENYSTNPFKNALNSQNKNEIITLCSEAIDYIKSLTFKDEVGAVHKVCKSKLKTGFVGLIVCMESLKRMFADYVETNIMSSIKTYYLLQDPLEIFFGKIRSRGGYNDNPNVSQFTAAYRKMLVNNKVFTSHEANCREFSTDTNSCSNILTVSSRRTKVIENNDEDDFLNSLDVDSVHEKLAEFCQDAESELADKLVDYTLVHMATLIEQRIKTLFYCLSCTNVLEKCEKVGKSFNDLQFAQPPCLSTYIICREVDKYLKLECLKGDIDFKIIYYSILNNIDIETLYTDSDFTCGVDHKFFLIRTVIDAYIQIKGYYFARTATQDIQTSCCRQKCRKLVQFYGV